MRWDSRLVRIFNDRMEQIALHPRKEPGGFSTPAEFIDPKKISGVERGAAWLLHRVTTRLGPKSTAWARAMIRARGVEGVRVLLGLLSLSGRHPTSAIEQACEIASGYGEYQPPDHPSALETPGTQARIAAIRERAYHDPTTERVWPVCPRRIPIPQRADQVMNQSFLKREWLNWLGQTPAGQVQTTLAMATAVQAKKRGTGLSSGSTRGTLPPTFTIASPSSSEGEAMAKAGGNQKVLIS